MTRVRWATPSSRRRRSTPASPSTRSATSRARSSGWASTSRADRRPPDRGPLARPRLEVADVFRTHGAAWREANAGHVSLAQLKAMSAIETCRTAALGGHVERCEDCAHERVAYNSCRNRHCPKCQGAAARQWLADREAELLPVRLLSRRLHPAGGDRRHRVPEQGRRLRPPVQDRRRDPHHHRRRPEASRARASASPPCSTPGARRSPIIRISMSSSPAAACPRTGRAGSPASQASSCPCACSRACSAASSSKASQPCTRPAASPSSAISPPLPISAPSTRRSRRCGAPSGSSTPSGPSPDRRPCSLILPATPTASRSQTPG